MTTTIHPWKFFRAGGFDQVKLESGADLANLDQLDQKLWVALACPTSGLEFDARTAALIDTDGDGRIRAAELIAACKFAAAHLKNPDELLKQADGLPVASINDATPEGKQLLASARKILANLGKKDAGVLTVADVADTARIFANDVLNGDGIIVPESAGDEATRALIAEAIACVGSLPDRSGKPGISAGLADAFFAELAAYEGWFRQGESPATLPLGDGTAAACAAVHAVRTKVDDYFGRCRLAAFDPRAAALLNRKEEEYLAVAAKDLSITATEVAGFPLAQVAADRPLPLRSGLNPAHAAAIATLVEAAVRPALGDRTELTEADWTTLQARVAPYAAWQAAKAGARVEALGIQRVREILAGPGREALATLIQKDLSFEPEARSIAEVEKLVRFYRDLHRLAVNFVNFKDLYDGGEPAIFQCGTLYLDQRSCSLCLTVADAGKHAAMAGLAGAYLAYVDCVRKATGETKSIVAIFSQGDDDNLMVGRNGLFYDRQGRDYDATITKIVSNPISLRQAFWSPYKKFVRMVEELVTKRAASADAAATAKLGDAAAVAASPDQLKPAAEPAKVDVGMVAALSVAFGSIGTAFAYLLGLFKGITLFQLVLLGAGMVALISGPAMILAYITLRKRNLGPILDANGWAVNAAARINVPFGTSLTAIARVPAGSSRDTLDPFAEKKSPWPRILVLAVVLYGAWQWSAGKLDSNLPEFLRYENHFGKKPASTAAPADNAPKAAEAAK